MRTPLFNFASADVTGVTDNYYDIVLSLENVSSTMAELLAIPVLWNFNSKAAPVLIVVQGSQWEEFLLNSVLAEDSIKLTRLNLTYPKSFSAGARVELRASATLLERFFEQQSAKARLYNNIYAESSLSSNLLLGPMFESNEDPFSALPDPEPYDVNNYIIGSVLASTALSGLDFGYNTFMGGRLRLAGQLNTGFGYGASTYGEGNTAIGANSGTNTQTTGQTSLGWEAGNEAFSYSTSLGAQARPKMERHAALAGVPYFDAPDDALGIPTGTFRSHTSAVTQIMGSRVRPTPSNGRYSTINLEDTYWVALQEVTLFIGAMSNNEPSSLELDIGLVDAAASTTNFRSLLRQPLDIGPLNVTDHSAKGYFNFPIDKGVCRTGQYLCFWLSAGTIDFRIYPYVRLMLGKS